MTAILKKEMKLSASALSYIFLAFSAMALIPGYPVLMGAFFIVFGLFQTFQRCRENNDIVYSALLPIAKCDVVRGKYAFAVLVELCGFLLMTVFTLIRMGYLSGAVPYAANALMTANFVFLGFVLLLFGCFNLIFIGGFFRTAYYYGKPFVIFLIVSFLVIGTAEALHHIPGLSALNTAGFEEMPLQLACLAAGAAAFVIMTLVSLSLSVRSFEKTDL